LSAKTQVIGTPWAYNFRNRLTHTLEAVGISRTVARALRLNEDLTEAIGLGHDLGHPPFGHAGEDALSAALGHGVRVVPRSEGCRVQIDLDSPREGVDLAERLLRRTAA